MPCYAHMESKSHVQTEMKQDHRNLHQETSYCVHFNSIISTYQVSRSAQKSPCWSEFFVLPTSLGTEGPRIGKSLQRVFRDSRDIQSLFLLGYRYKCGKSHPESPPGQLVRSYVQQRAAVPSVSPLSVNHPVRWVRITLTWVDHHFSTQS